MLGAFYRSLVIRAGKRRGKIICRKDLPIANASQSHKKRPHALHILDRYHIVTNLNQALNQVRAEEARKLANEG